MSAAARAGVHDAPASERAEIYASLSHAFEDDPVTRFLFPDARTRRARLREFYAVLVPNVSAHGRLLADARCRAAAVWQAPEPPHPNGVQALVLLARMGIALRSRTRAGLALGATLERVRVREPHWYLGILGTAPAHQGSGLGSALLEPVLAECDDQGTVAYLESSKRANIPFYERHGFEVIEEVRIAGGPSLWPMRREPRGRVRTP